MSEFQPRALTVLERNPISFTKQNEFNTVSHKDYLRKMLVNKL